MILYLSGLFIYAIPDMQRIVQERKNDKVVENFREKLGENQQGEGSDKSGGESADVTDGTRYITRNEQLYQEMQKYNQQIFSEGQSGLTDPWAYEQEMLDLSKYGICDGVIGVLDIPKMGVTLPLYLGATQEKMAKGAVMLGETSFPVEGTDSNCVIAAHRGWKGIPMFSEIERLELGDELTIQNCRETLVYRVSGIEIIFPNEIDKVMIQPGRNMVTLITCHPYTQNSRRYVVYCEEVGTQQENLDTEKSSSEEFGSENNSCSEESMQNRVEAIKEDQNLIARDTIWRKAGYIVIGLLGVILVAIRGR